MNILIIESSQESSLQIQQILHQLRATYKISSIACLFSIREARDWFQTNHFPDLILANTQLNDGTTINLFLEIQLNLNTPIIFITEHSRDVLQAFKFNVIDYILKPYQLLDLRNSFQKLAQLYPFNRSETIEINSQLYKDRFLIRLGNRMILQKAAEIAYFYADNKTVFSVNTSGEKSIINYNLTELEKILNPRIFFRLNRKYIINISSIKEIKVQSNYNMRVMLHPMQRVNISRARINEFKTWAGA
ncbi:MAG: LytR/AlgR family response regulator transcription factor [Flammeovirgaceae bacterium]